MEVRPFKEADEAAWNAYVSRSEGSDHSHRAGWRRVVASAYGHRSFYLLAEEDGEVKGVLPMIFIRSVLFGRSLVSMPYLDDGGIQADSKEAADGLLSGAVRLYEEMKADSLDLRHRRANGLDLPRHGTKVTLRLGLTGEAEEMWKGFNPKLRNQIRKAEKAGLSTVFGGRELLGDFYGVFCVNMRDLGSPVHGRSYFEAILEEFGDSSELIVLYQGHKPIGGGLCLSHRGTLTMPWASSLRSHFSLSPNNLLYWNVIRRACEKKYQTFDFGRSSPGSGTYHFKKQWGSAEEPLNWQGLNRKREASTTVSAENPGFRWVSRTWRMVPLPLTQWIGPRLRGSISN